MKINKAKNELIEIAKQKIATLQCEINERSEQLSDWQAELRELTSGSSPVTTINEAKIINQQIQEDARAKFKNGQLERQKREREAKLKRLDKYLLSVGGEAGSWDISKNIELGYQSTLRLLKNNGYSNISPSRGIWGLRKV